MLGKLVARRSRKGAERRKGRKSIHRQGSANRPRNRWRPVVEHLEQRRLLAGLVGVDFGPPGSSAPTGWTSLGTLSTPFTQANLAAEDGIATPFDLTIVETGPATPTCPANQVCSAGATPAAATIPTHSQSLSGLDGQIFSDAHPVTLTWSDLTAGDRYEVYVFGLEGHFSSVQQTVQISGGGAPISFAQNLNRNQLFVNGEMGSSARPLSSYAKIAAADSAGRITIQVSPTAFSLDVSLGGIALRPLSPAGLTVTIAADSISESAGPAATTATVSRSSDTANPLTVSLTSSDVSEATVPATVTIAAGQAISAPINIAAVDDTINDGTQTVAITAAAFGHADGTDSVSVLDDEAAALTLTILAAAISEGDGTAATTAVVSRNSATANALTVSLVSNDLTEATVPATITIPAGQAASPPFNVSAVDDVLDDGTQTVGITASALGHDAGSDTVDVVDDDVTAGLAVVVAADSISEAAGAGATTATVSRRTGLAVNRVDRGSIAADGVFGTQISTNQVDGGFAANFRVENPNNSAQVHQVSHESSIDALGLDGEGFATIRDQPGFFRGIGDTSFFDVYFDLTTAHTFALTGRVAADSNNAAASATIGFSGPGTTFSFSQFAGLGSVGGLTLINQSGELAPGTYHFSANASAAAPGPAASADANYVFDLQLQPSVLVVNLASSDTTEATVPATITVAAGQSSSPAFGIDAVDDQVRDGTQTVTIAASAAQHADGSDTLDVTDNEAAGFTVTETDDSTLVFEDGTTDTLGVVLDTPPSSNVVLTVSSADVGEALVSPALLTFTSSNWDQPQTVTVTGVADPIVDGDQVTAVTISVDDSASDDRFDSIADQLVQVTTRDVDGSIRGTVWDDADGNQVQNNEPGLPGVTVYLDLNRNGQLDSSEPTQVSDANGNYSFENLSAVEYVVGQVVPAGLIQTFPQDAFPASTFAQLVNNQSTLPVFATHAPRDSSRLFIVEKGGVIRILDLVTGQLNSTPFLTVPDTDAGASESGLLGLAFHPDYANNGKFYVNVTVDNGSDPGPFATHIREYRVSSNPDVADPTSKREILSFDQPFGNHNGGWIDFGPHDSYLYIASGDGGSGGDPLNSGQSLNTLLGKLLRIDVNGDAFPNNPNANYAIPPSNPFANQAATRAEIWAYGLRNPWRNSFDRATGDLWIGDVGQSAREEIDFQAAASTGGENYAWNRREGFLPFRGGQLLPGDVQPVYDYAHGNGPLQGNSVIGGFVYRGPIDDFAARYVFADSRSDNVWSFDPASPVNTVRRINELLVPDAGTIGGGRFPDDVVSFAEDSTGNVYLVEIDGEIHKMSKRLPGTHTVIVIAGQVVGDINFGNRDPHGSSISDFVWHDLDRDGVQDSGEPGVDGVRVKLLDASSLQAIADTSTTGGGKYGFDGLAAGRYIVEFAAADAFRFSPQDQGGDDSLDSDAHPETGRSAVIALPASTNINTVDAGLVRFETPTLRLVIAADSISEGAGPEATTATVSRNSRLDNPLTVSLGSSDTSESTVRRTVVIPAGQSTSAPFAVNAIDDRIVDGTQIVTLTARAEEHEAGADRVAVTDDDRPGLTVAIAAAVISEGGGQAATTLIVTRNTAPTNALAVTLASSDTSEATVPRTITIPAGQTTSGRIPVAAVDDAIIDGTQTVTITAQASEHADGSDTVDVADNDGGELKIDDLETNASMEHKGRPGETVVVGGKFSGATSGERLSVEFRWGDGTRTVGRIDPAAGRFSGEHRYRSGGIFEVDVILINGTRRTARASIETVVSGVRLTADGTLQIIGTRGNDIVRVAQLRSRVRVQAKFPGQRWETSQFPAARVRSLLVVACDGNDRVQINRSIRQSATVLGGPGNDVIRSGRGRDVIDGGPGNDFISSGSGADRVTDRQGSNRIFSGGGDDFVTTGGGRDRIVTGDGNDVVRSGAGRDWIDTGNGHDVIFAGEGHDTAKGGRGDDEVHGGPGNDVLHGGAGNGSDVVHGDDGHDRVYGGGNGRNRLMGGRGNDRIWGGRGPDKIDAGDGRDYVLAGNGNDIVDGGADHDVINAGGGDDLVRAGAGNDLVIGGAGNGNDILLGQEGNDRIYGGNGRDILIGGLGRDLLVSQDGADILIGGTTDHDGNDAALEAILTEWSSGSGYLTRVRNLRTGRGSLGGIRLGANVTVHDDGAQDLMLGGRGRDWFFADLNGPDRDILRDRNTEEEVDLL